MKMILFNQNPMITKLLESVSKKLELSMENFNRYQELPTRLKEEPEWILIADDECLEKLDQVDWLELKEIISQNKNSVCMYKKGNEAQPFLEGFEMKIKKPFLPTEVLKVLQKKLGSNMSELEPSQNLDPTQEVLETNWDELENLGDLKALVQEEPNNEEQLLPTLNDQEEKEEVKETPQEEEKPKDDETQENETPKDKEVSKELEMQEEVKEEEQEEVKEEEQVKEQESIKEETQEQVKEQEPIKEETQEIKEEKQEKTQDSPSAQELEAMQELVKEIQENSNGQEDKKETQENTETPQEKETQENTETPQEKEKQELETPQEKETQKLETPQEKETQESAETPQDKETQENTETPQEKETQKLETPQEEIQENTEKTQKLETQEDHYESIEDIPEPVMAQAMGEELPFLNESVAKIPNNENDTETPKESAIKTPQEKEGSNKTSSPLELHLNLQDLLKSLNQESLKSLLENKTLSIKITLEDKKPDA